MRSMHQGKAKNCREYQDHEKTYNERILANLDILWKHLSMKREEFEVRVKTYATQIFANAKTEMTSMSPEELADFWRRSFILLEQNDLKELRDFWMELKLIKTIVVLDRLIQEIDFIQDNPNETLEFGQLH